jgi:kinesin family protein 3/17
VLEGYNGTMFAYGQTGCGKTHTMMGPSAALDPGSPDSDQRGIIPRAVRQIFGFIEAADKNIKFLVRCSYLEIYNENILDLLASRNSQEHLQIKEDPNKGIFVKDLTTVIVKSVPELEKMLFAGMKNRKTGETAMNKDSSRSHSIFTIYIETAQTVNVSELLLY